MYPWRPFRSERRRVSPPPLWSAPPFRLRVDHHAAIDFRRQCDDVAIVGSLVQLGVNAVQRECVALAVETRRGERVSAGGACGDGDLALPADRDDGDADAVVAVLGLLVVALILIVHGIPPMVGMMGGALPGHKDATSQAAERVDENIPRSPGTIRQAAFCVVSKGREWPVFVVQMGQCLKTGQLSDEGLGDGKLMVGCVRRADHDR